MQDLVSIIMPAYNCEKYITQAINSVIAQSYQNFELIIIDDCSNDNTVEIIKELCKNDNRIKTYFNEKNIGVAATRSRGVSLANGEWIAFIDSDDCWEKRKLDKQVDCITTNNAEFVFTGSSFIDELSNPYNAIFEVPYTVNYKQLLKQNVISCSSVLIMKSYMEMFNMDNDNTHEDYSAWLRILKTIPFAYGINEPLLIYRITRTSKSGNKLKSLMMAYRTYRYVGLGLISSCYYMCWYIVRGIRKYKKNQAKGAYGLKMERVLHVVSTIGINSGVMSFLMSYYRNINRDKIQFDFLFWVDEDKSYAEEIRNLGGEVYKIQKPGFSRASLQSLLLFFKQNNQNHKIMHLHEVYLNMIVCPIARKYGFIHIISHCHTTKYSDKLINALRNRVLCLPLKSNVDAFFACSKDAGEFYYGKRLHKQGKIQIINNAIDCSKFSYDVKKRENIREKMKLNNKFVVGHVGRFNNQKNHEFLIDIFYEIHKKNNEAILLLVGLGPLEEKIKEKVRKKLPEKTVIFLGQINNINEILQGMDVFILPSLFEGLGIVLIEAQMSGLRCIASNTVPKEAQITENISFLSLELSAQIWANTVVSNTIESRYIDLKKIADAGFDIDVEAKKLVECYLGAI